MYPYYVRYQDKICFKTRFQAILQKKWMWVQTKQVKKIGVQRRKVQLSQSSPKSNPNSNLGLAGQHIWS